jgi:hypothetical protein
MSEIITTYCEHTKNGVCVDCWNKVRDDRDELVALKKREAKVLELIENDDLVEYMPGLYKKIVSILNPL